MQRPFRTLLALLCGVAFASHATPARAAGFKLLYSFQGGSKDGSNPQAAMISAGQMLYGTTLNGGSQNDGTVFSISSKTGVETVLHAFGGSSDGNGPAAGLLKIGTTLYGTTVGGGSASEGTVFSVNLNTGREKVLYSFSGGSDGANPQSRLIEDGGLLYGTTMNSGGGSCGFGCGTVFSIDPATGAEKTVHVFQGGSDGANPNAGVTKIGRTLYGTTLSGGAGNAGTVFTLNLVTGVEKVVHIFDSQADGTNPVSGLLKFSGGLYGATVAGGSAGLGAVYAFDRKTGGEQILHSFQMADGALPEGGIIELGGTLYGTTSLGGGSNDGVVFSIDPATGAEQVVHSFSGSDGAGPWAGLTKLGGTLFGTASGGGSAGAGVIFAITP